MKKILLAIAALIVIVGGVALLSGSRKGTLAYTNTLVGYTIHTAPGWHISTSLTRTIDQYFYLTTLYASVGCGSNNIAALASSTDPLAAMRACAEKTANYANLQSKYLAFTNAWDVNNAELVLATNFSADEEKTITLDQLANPQKLEKGRFLAIRPFDRLISFTASSTSSNGLVRDFFKLDAGTQAYLDDWRASTFAQQGLVLSIPVHGNSYLYSGEKTESLTLISSAPKGSAAEADFFSMAKTVTVK